MPAQPEQAAGEDAGQLTLAFFGIDGKQVVERSHAGLRVEAPTATYAFGDRPAVWRDSLPVNYPVGARSVAQNSLPSRF